LKAFLKLEKEIKSLPHAASVCVLRACLFSSPFSQANYSPCKAAPKFSQKKRKMNEERGSRKRKNGKHLTTAAAAVKAHKAAS
jgi:hypothetical protein